MREVNNECAFCKEPIDPSKEPKAKVISTIEFGSTTNGKVSINYVDEVLEVAHIDCWEGKNRMFPARRRKLELGGI